MQTQAGVIGVAVAIFFGLAAGGCQNSDAEGLLNLKHGDEAEAKGDFDLAMSYYTEAIRINPKQPDAYFNRGVIYEKKGEHDKALAEFTEAIGIKPKYANAYNNRGAIYREKGENDKALADYTAAIQINPKQGKAYYNRGVV